MMKKREGPCFELLGQSVCELMLWICCWHGDKNNFYFGNSFHFKGT